MNIHQGLKEKNRLAGQIKQIDERIRINSRWVKGNVPSYDVLQLLEERSRIVDMLITLKLQISLATAPVIHKILQMAECKALITVLKGLELSKGMDDTSHRRGYALTAATIEYDTAMTQRQRDQKIDAVQIEISRLQDELDHFNAVTELK